MAPRACRHGEPTGAKRKLKARRAYDDEEINASINFRLRSKNDCRMLDADGCPGDWIVRINPNDFSRICYAVGDSHISSCRGLAALLYELTDLH